MDVLFIFFFCVLFFGALPAAAWLAEMLGRIAGWWGGWKKRGARSYKMAILAFYFRARFAELILKFWDWLPHKRGS